ncbi:MAG TPA: AarF/ABC1/UbiB kinase family protein [Nocardioidaceae bacterium]|nr:AarF/ABC1/UbiB kinase family protein [Nocardioidaceae bacterium]
MSDNTKIPTSRAARTAVLGRLAAGQAARHAGAKISTLGRSDERKAEVMDRRVAEAASALVDALGLMRGAAMKVGQMLSMLDVGLIPEEFREDFQRSLADLRDNAPTVRFNEMRAVIEGDLGSKMKDVFSSFDETPVGAASIGQVYRATLLDGREVAVKVQYPGIDRAVRADLKNLGMVMRAIKLIAPEMDVAALTEEIRARIEEELDYELEAQNQRMAARLYADHPFIFVPAVISSLCGPHVLVSEFFEGRKFDDIAADPDQALRDRVGEIIFRFFGGSLYAHAQFSPDPHPGNFLVADDGRVAFLDFGLYRHVGPEAMATQKGILQRVFERDEAGLHSLLHSSGFIMDPAAVTPEIAMAYVREVFWWMAEPDITLTSDRVNKAMARVANPASDYFNLARKQNMPSDFIFIVRMVVMVMAAVGQLESKVDWNAVAREWLFDDEPVTELGRQERAYRFGTPLAVTA